MIGKISIGKSFRGCLSYCLEDKSQKMGDEPVKKDRAEVLCYNLCFGDKKELIGQFNEVRNLNPKLAKPVLHITLSLAPGEKLSPGLLREMVYDCTQQLGFDKNQYIGIFHNDTGHQHLHIVANRVGLNGKTVKDGNNYRQIADYCRKMELKYNLKQVLSPRRYLSKELRQIPRLDARKEKLRNHISESLSKCQSFADFERMMRNKGYELIKQRGISFLDKQKVKVKGSQVGYSLQTIEKLLSLKPELRTKEIEQKEQRYRQQISQKSPAQILQQNRPDRKHSLQAKDIKKEQQLNVSKVLKESKALEILMAPEKQNFSPDYHLIKKRKKRSQHL